ncbi:MULTISPECIES: hypothetical protein [Bacillus]|uniref:Uncharacterized protein n=1 Tax=Bacillus cereus TaxID=1396 RepID=A0A164L3P4_BACCE|nr:MULTISPECIES: hypothetical protein [Bacillus]KZD54565.1 hypothetical protein B4088_5668 [Bacillus cereus]TSI10021.1 hypothetical protein FOT98_23525 [Bacillus sp. HY001]
MEMKQYTEMVEKINGLKTMEEILNELEKAFIGDCPFEELSYARQSMIYNKFQLRDEIEDGFITDIEKAKKWWELIELVHEWAMNDEFDIEHRLHFANGVVDMDSISEYCGGDWTLDYKDGALYLDGENHGDSILHLLNYIESIL